MKNPFRAIGNFFKKTLPQGAKSFFTKTIPNVVNKIPSPVLSVATGGISDVVSAGIKSKGDVREFANQFVKGQAKNLSQIGALGTKVLANPITATAVSTLAPELLPVYAGAVAGSKAMQLAGSTLEKARTAQKPTDAIQIVEGGIKVNQQVKKIK